VLRRNVAHSGDLPRQARVPTEGGDGPYAIVTRVGPVGTCRGAPRVHVTPNKDEARPYRSYYSPDTQGLVAEWYEPEIALLGYGF